MVTVKRMSSCFHVVLLFVEKLFTEYTSYKSKEHDVLFFYPGNLEWKRQNDVCELYYSRC